MKTYLIQHGSGSYAALLALSHEQHQWYAEAHKMLFLTFHTQFNPSPFGWTAANKAMLRTFLQEIDEGDLVILLDADTLIQDNASPYSVMPEWADMALLGCREWVNTGVLFMRNSPALRMFWKDVFSRGPVSEVNNMIDPRVRERLSDTLCQVKVFYLDDSWNWFDKYQGAARKVCCPKEQAHVLAWHGMPVGDVENAMREELAA